MRLKTDVRMGCLMCNLFSCESFCFALKENTAMQYNVEPRHKSQNYLGEVDHFLAYEGSEEIKSGPKRLENNNTVNLLCAGGSKYDLESKDWWENTILILSFSLLLVFSVSPPLGSLSWRLSSFLSLSRRLVSPPFSPSLPLSLCRADGSGLGCDPITGWLQQSPSADWFYNPHSGSQMGENQLAKKCCSESCHTDARTDGVRVEKHTHTRRLSSSLSGSIS